jgi:hypothetical protein
LPHPSLLCCRHFSKDCFVVFLIAVAVVDDVTVVAVAIVIVIVIIILILLVIVLIVPILLIKVSLEDVLTTSSTHVKDKDCSLQWQWRLAAEDVVNSRKTRETAGDKKHAHRQENAQARCDCDCTIFNAKWRRKPKAGGDNSSHFNWQRCLPLLASFLDNDARAERHVKMKKILRAKKRSQWARPREASQVPDLQSDCRKTLLGD